MKIGAAKLKLGLMQLKRSLCEAFTETRRPMTVQNLSAMNNPVAQRTSSPNSYLQSPLPPQPYWNDTALQPQSAPVHGLGASTSTLVIPMLSGYMNNEDQSVNASIDTEVESEALTSEEELDCVKEFLDLQSAFSNVSESGNQNGVATLCHGAFRTEKAHGNHMSGVIIGKFMNHYRLNAYGQMSFTEYLGTINQQLFEQIMAPEPGKPNYFAPGSNESQEIFRRVMLGVRYLTPEKRAKYNVTVQGSLFYWEKWGKDRPLDTTHSDFYKRKHGISVGSADESAIWVMTKKGKLYTHPSRMHRFHHTSFKAGKDILCGGDWEVTGGKLKMISLLSGHYRPTFEHLRNTVKVLANDYGINCNTYNVKVWDTSTAAYKQISAAKILFDGGPGPTYLPACGATN